MRIKFNSIHSEESVTVNQSLITGTHSEAAGILNFLTNSLGLSPPLFLNEQNIGKQFFCAKESPFLPWNSSLSSQVQEEKSHQFESVLAQVAEFSNLKPELGEKCFFYSFSNGVERFNVGLKSMKMSESSAPRSDLETVILTARRPSSVPPAYSRHFISHRWRGSPGGWLCGLTERTELGIRKPGV